MLKNINMIRLFNLETVNRTDKLSTVLLVKIYMDLDIKSRKEGILSLLDDLVFIDNQLVKQFLKIILEGFGTDIIDDFVILKLASAACDASFRFTLFLVWIGTKMILSGEHPSVMYAYFRESFGPDSDLVIPMGYEDMRQDEQISSDLSISEGIDNTSFNFADLVKLSDENIKKILREIPNETLTGALSIATPDIRSKIFQNMTSKGARILSEDIDCLRPSVANRASQYQKNIQSLIDNMIRVGEIDVNYLPMESQ